MKTLLSLAFASAVLSSAATAQVTTIQTANPAPKGQDLDKIICEVTQTTGSRLGARKVCKTALEWQQLKNDTQQGVQKVQQQATSTGTPQG